MAPPGKTHKYSDIEFLESFSLKNYIIFENDQIIVINKPSGLLSIPDGFDPSLPNLKDILGLAFGRIWVVHRLDRGTSGVMISAKNNDTHKFLNTEFMERRTKKLLQSDTRRPVLNREKNQS